MANRFFYLWRCIWLFSSATTLIFLFSSPVSAGYSFSSEISPSSISFNASVNSANLYPAYAYSDTAQLFETVSGGVYESHQVNFVDQACYNIGESLKYNMLGSVISSYNAFTLLTCSISNLTPTSLDLAFSFSYHDYELNKNVTGVYNKKTLPAVESCFSMSGGDFYSNAGNYDENGKPYLFKIDYNEFFTDYVTYVNNRDHSCIYNPSYSVPLDKIKTDPPVDLNSNPQGCFEYQSVSNVPSFSHLLTGYYLSQYNKPSLNAYSSGSYNSVKVMPTTNTCATVISDIDNDGVPDSTDKCKDKGKEINGAVTSEGCPVYQDNDNDGIPEHDGNGNSPDKCPASPSGEVVNSLGCGESSSQYYGDFFTKINGDPYYFFKRIVTEPIYSDYAISMTAERTERLDHLLNSTTSYSFSALSIPETNIVNSSSFSNSLFVISDIQHHLNNIHSFNLSLNINNDLDYFKFDSISSLRQAITSVVPISDYYDKSLSSTVEIYDYSLCKTVSMPAVKLEITPRTILTHRHEASTTTSELLGSKIYVDKIPYISKSEYDHNKSMNIINHSIPNPENPDLPLSIPLKNANTQKNLYSNSQCSSDLQVLECYYNNNANISENGFVSCKSGSDGGGNVDFTIPKYISNNPINPRFNNMLSNNQALNTANDYEFSFGSTRPACPVYHFDFSAIGLGYQSVSSHCNLISNYRLPLDVMFYGLWSFIAVRVFLSA